VAVGEDAQTIEDVHEPYLIQEGFLQRTAQGRVLAAKAWEVLGLNPASSGGQQGSLPL